MVLEGNTLSYQFDYKLYNQTYFEVEQNVMLVARDPQNLAAEIHLTIIICNHVAQPSRPSFQE